MPVLPVTISLFVSYVSAISYLGDPVEAYYYGWIFMALGLGNAFSMIFVAHFFAPRYHEAEIISVYEHVGQVYNYKVQVFSSTVFILQEISWLAIALYSPSLALSQVSGLPVWATITIIGVVSTFYTTLGGMKAVLWADTAQTFVMIAGLLAVLVRGSMLLGGLDQIWHIAKEDDRFNLKAVYWNLPMFLVVIPLFGLIGQLMYAYYRHCDPMMRGRIERSDQMLPLMMVEILSPFPGLPGLFLAATCSASLSSLSSGQSAIVACLIRDFIEPIYGKMRNIPGFHLSDRTANVTAKVAVVLLGFLLMGCAWLTMSVGGIIFQMTTKIMSFFGAPILGIFILAMCCPFVTCLPACVGVLVTFPLLAWISLGSTIYPPPDSRLPLSIDSCFANVTQGTTQVMPTYSYDVSSGSAENIYSLSPLLLQPLGAGCTVFIALGITAVTWCFRNIRKGRQITNDKTIDKQYELEKLENANRANIEHC